MNHLTTSDRPFDQHRHQVGMVYAQGLIGAAAGAGIAPAVLAELDSLIDDVVVPLADFERLMVSPRITLPEKNRILDRLFAARMTPLLLNFLKVVARHARMDCLREMRACAWRVWNETRGCVEVQVTTAAPLDGRARSEVEFQLAQRLGRPVELRERVDPNLLGGMVVRIGDTVFDGSLDHRLSRLRARSLETADHLVHASLPKFVVAGGK